MFLKYIITPVMGTVIGYGTNYIAVKMLFRPRNEIKLWGHTLPFTPGAIPKGKPRLAKAIGSVVGNTLVTKDDIKERLLNQKTEDLIIEKITEILSSEIKSEIMKVGKLDEEAYSQAKTKLSVRITKQIVEVLNNMGVSDVIADECSKVIKEKFQHSMLKMFLTDELVGPATKMLGDEVQKYIDKNGEKMIGGEVSRKLDTIETQSVSELLESVNISKEKLNETVSKMYKKSVDKALDELFAKLDIEKMIEDKINAMDMDELERLVLQVMKKELDTIVNLGAVIGLVLGLVNMAINALF